MDDSKFKFQSANHCIGFLIIDLNLKGIRKSLEE